MSTNASWLGSIYQLSSLRYVTRSNLYFGQYNLSNKRNSPDELAILSLLKAFSTALLLSTFNHGYGYKNLAKQSPRGSILFCVHEHVYQS